MGRHLDTPFASNGVRSPNTHVKRQHIVLRARQPLQNRQLVVRRIDSFAVTFFHRALTSPNSVARIGTISIRDTWSNKWLTFSVYLATPPFSNTGSATPGSGCGRTDATFAPSVIAFASTLDARISTKSCGGSHTPLRETLVNQSAFALTPVATLLSLH